MQMQVNMIIQPLAFAIAFFDGRGFAEHHLASCVQLVKTLKTLELHDNLYQVLHIICFNIFFIIPEKPFKVILTLIWADLIS